MKTPLKPPGAPEARLSPEAASWYRKLEVDFGIVDAAGQILLLHALTHWDRVREAEMAVKRDGMLLEQGPGGAGKLHPLMAVIRDSGNAFRSAMKALALDPAPEAKSSGGQPLLHGLYDFPSKARK